MRLVMLRQTAVEREPYRPIISIALGTCLCGLLEALGDKIILSKLLENLGVPQMPVLRPQHALALFACQSNCPHVREHEAALHVHQSEQGGGELGTVRQFEMCLHV